VAFDSGIDRLDSGVCERGGDKREGFLKNTMLNLAARDADARQEVDFGLA
jgi:hypothetical protein